MCLNLFTAGKHVTEHYSIEFLFCKINYLCYNKRTMQKITVKILRRESMETREISGQRQMEFLENFNYIREAGTENEKKAAETILDTLKSFGVRGHLEEFPFETFQIKNARLRITKPYEKEYTVTGYGRCQSTAKEGITAPFLYVENGDDISLSYARGKIVLVNDPVRKEMYRKLVQAGAVGFLSITGSPLDEGEDLKPRMYSLPKSLEKEKNMIQGASIHYKDAVELVTLGAEEACLTVQQETVTRISENVVVRIEGTDRAEEILTLTAHFDSVPEGPGAYDNMAGAAIIMELCRYFTKHRPRRTLEFIWFGAEEKGLLGSQEYVRAHEAELYRHRFNMNVDLAGQLVGGTVVGVTGDASVCQMITYMAHEIGMGMTTKNQIWGSDSNTFAWKGIPAMTLNRDGFGMHTRHDTIDLLSAWSLERSAVLLGYIADRLANIEVMPFVREVAQEFLAQLEEYFAGTH